jgi:hypothetical protein
MTVVIDRTKPPSAVGNNPGPVSAAALARRKAGRGGGLYQPRVPIYPKLAHGKWRTIKWLMLIATLGVYWIVPWIRWDRPGGLPRPGGAGRLHRPPVLLLLHPALAAGGLLHHRPAGDGRALACSW